MIAIPASLFLFHGPDFQLQEMERCIEAERIAVRSADALLGKDFVSEGPSVLLVDQSLVRQKHYLDKVPNDVIVVTVDASAEAALGDAADMTLSSISDVKGKLALLRAAFKLSAERLHSAQVRLELDRVQTELNELSRIGGAFMEERDRPALVRQILEHAVRHTSSDMAVILLVEEDPEGGKRLRRRMMISNSMPQLAQTGEETYPINDTTGAGHVARTKQPLVIDDAYHLPADADYTLNVGAVERLGYWARSVLIIPLFNHRDVLIGVLELFNRKRDPAARIRRREDLDRYVIPYSERDVQVALSVAGQAALLIENAMLYMQIEGLFENFIKAAVTGIDQRDPTMAGHSVRVAALTTDLANAIARTATGVYAPLKFSSAQMRELKYAAMMHDLGKLGVNEDVLVKAKKLPPVLWERVQGRFDLIRCALDLEYEKKRTQLVESGRDRKLLAALAAELKQRHAQIDQFQNAIRAANEPTLLFEKTADILFDVANQTFDRPDGRIESYLTTDELHYLQIPLGSLDEHERREVETHATETYIVLSQIRWTDDLKGIVDYASGHHEKLNGSGYPRHLTAENIPVQTRMITIADIFDALTAADRPYKKAVAPEQALDIMQSEANAGLLDVELMRIMIESQAYNRILETDWRQL